MNIVTPFIPYFQPPKLVQPGQRTFHHPAIYPQTAAMFGSPFGQYRADAYFTQGLAMWFGVITAIAVKTLEAISRTTRLSGNGRNSVDQRQQLRHIMTIGTAELYDYRQSIGISQQVMFRPQFPSIRRIGARFRPPDKARTDAESTTAREKSIWSACRSLFSRRWWILSQIPRRFQACRRRQQVIPEPQPISWGRYSQGTPVFRTKRIPVKAARCSIGGRPPFGRDDCLGSRGSMSSHNLSGRSGLAMAVPSVTAWNVLYLSLFIHRPYHYQKLRFC